MTTPLDKAALDQMRCATPDCNCGGELTFHSACHPTAPTWVTYADGTLTVTCAACDKTVAAVLVMA